MYPTSPSSDGLSYLSFLFFFSFSALFVSPVYDISERSSFENVIEWLKEIDIYNNNDDCVRLLVGNKIDREDDRQISSEEGAAFAKAHSMLFIECSAKTQSGVQQAFEELVQKVDYYYFLNFLYIITNFLKVIHLSRVRRLIVFDCPPPSLTFTAIHHTVIVA